MNAASTGDWVYWLIAGVFGALALVVLYFALLHDRSRGRRRCPRCWYDMSGSGLLTCSECGKTVRCERNLFRTRRRWRFALVAVALLCLSYLAWRGPLISARGWQAGIPNSALALVARWVDQPSSLLGLELLERINRGELSGLDWWLLINWAWTDDARRIRIEVITRNTWPVDVPLQAEVRFTRGWLRNSPLRVVVTRRDNGSVYKSSFDNPCATFNPVPTYWDDGTFSCGRLNDGVRAITFDIALQRTEGCAWVDLFETSEVVKVAPVESEVAVMTPVADPQLDALLAKHLRLIVSGEHFHGLYIDVSSPIPPELSQAFQGVTLAVRADIVSGDTVIMQTVYWWREGMIESCQFRGWLPFEGDRMKLVELICDSKSDIAVRISAHPDFALRDFPSDRYWEGTIELPLEVWWPGGRIVN